LVAFGQASMAAVIVVLHIPNISMSGTKTNRKL
jgi:hypothetical protein